MLPRGEGAFPGEPHPGAGYRVRKFFGTTICADTV